MAVPHDVAAPGIDEHPIWSDPEAGVDRGLLLAEVVHDPDRLTLDLQFAKIERDREQRVLPRETEHARAVRRTPSILDQDLGLPGTRIENADSLAVHRPFVPDGAQEHAAIAG